MDDEKLAPLIWDFFKLMTAVVITAFPILSITCDLWIYEGLIVSLAPHGAAAISMLISVTQLPAILAGLWGWQAIHNSSKATGVRVNKLSKNYLVVHVEPHCEKNNLKCYLRARPTDSNKVIRVCLIMNVIVGIVCIIAMLMGCMETPLVLLVFPGSLLFYVLVILTSYTAFVIRGRFFLHLITIYYP